jgi:hypothetical protein
MAVEVHMVNENNISDLLVEDRRFLAFEGQERDHHQEVSKKQASLELMEAKILAMVALISSLFF